MKNYFYIFVIAFFLFSSCGKRLINFNSNFPPLKEIPEEVQTILLIDRTATEEKEGNLIEGILTGDKFSKREENKQNTLMGVEEQLRNFERFTVIRATEVMIGGTSDKTLELPMTHDELDELCKKYNVDAVLALESYDTDFIVTRGRATSGGFYAQGVSRIHTGFRFYSCNLEDLYDEHTVTHTMRWRKGGNSILDAIGAMIDKNEADRAISYEAGRIYGTRISPSVVRVQRRYYRKGHSDVKYAARLMESNDWSRALNALHKFINEDHRRRHKGFAAHNLAVVYEILGDYYEAKHWATEAWAKYRNKESKNYSSQLDRMIVRKGGVD